MGYTQKPYNRGLKPPILFLFQNNKRVNHDSVRPAFAPAAVAALLPCPDVVKELQEGQGGSRTKENELY